MTTTINPWPPNDRRDRMRPIQQITSERLHRGWQTVVPATLMTEVDAGDILARREELTAKGQRASLTAVIATRLAQVLTRHPHVNCRLDGEELITWDSVNLGVAISANGRDLVVGVVREAESCDESQMSERIADLRRRAEGRGLRSHDTVGAAVTLSSVGMLINDVVGTPIVPPGQTAVLLVSGVTKKPVVVDGAIVARPLIPVSLTVDHRVVNGADMSAFLSDFCATLKSES